MTQQRRGRAVVNPETREPYVPEYKRLNIEPTQAVPTDARVNQNLSVGRKPAVRRVPLPPQPNVSRQAPPNIGNKDQYWMDDKAVRAAQPIPQFDEENDFVDTETLQGFDPLDGGSRDDEAWLRSGLHEEYVNAPNGDINLNPNDADSNPGDYLVYSGNKLLFRSPDEETIKVRLWTLLTSMDLDVSEVKVFKHLGIDAGVILL